MRLLLKHYCSRFLLVLILSLPAARKGFAQDDYKIVINDLLNFWEAYDALASGGDTTAIFQKLVFDRASEPFKIFIKKGNITARNYASQVRSFPNFYKSIRANTIRLAHSENEIRRVVARFKEMYPGFVPADICIAFGNFYTGGTVHVDNKSTLVYIGLEYHGLDSSANISEFKGVTLDYLSRSNFFRTVIHELVHVQQETHGRPVTKVYYGDKLIHSVLREGIPDFVARLVYPYGNEGRYIAYGMINEEGLKQKLKAELWEADKTYWMYNSRTATDQPTDLGYFMGSRIAHAYYEKNHSHANIIKQLIEISDINAFLSGSEYFMR